MMSLGKRNISRNLGASSAFAIVVLVIVCVAFLHTLTQQEEVMREIEARDVGRTEMVGALLREVSENQRMLSETLTAAAARELQEEGVFDRGRRAIDFVRNAEDRFAKLRPLFADGDDLAEIFGVASREFKAYRGTVIDVVEISTVNANLAATQMLKATASFVRLVEDISQAAELSNDQTMADIKRMRAREQRSIEYMLAGSVVAVGTLLLVSFFFYSRMQRAGAAVRIAETKQRELEKQLHHSQKLEALGTLAGGVAHELNNALTPICALSKTVRNGLPPGSMDREDLDLIITAGERAQKMVQSILSFSRKQDRVKTYVDLADLVRQSLRMVRATIPPTVRIEQRIGAVPPIPADADQLSQVIVNLVTNAAQAIGSANGTITVGLAVDEGITPDASIVGWLRLWFADTGSGMDAATVERIFEPFFTTKEVGQGTGLGLSVVHGIIVDHGGRIGVESELGSGTTFTVYLPLAEAAAAFPEDAIPVLAAA